MLGIGSSISSASYKPFSSTKSLTLDGSNDYIDCGSIALGTDDFSISLWVKTDDFYNKFFISEYVDDDNRWYLRGGTGTPPKLQFYQVIGGVATSLYLGSSISLDDHQNAWTHIVLTSDRDGKVIGYVNGVADSADKNGNATNLTTTANTVIGKYAGSTYSDYQIDEVAIWNSALSADAVTALYNNGSPTELTSAKGNYTAQANLKAWWRMGDGSFDDLDQAGNSGALAAGFITDQHNPGFGPDLFESGEGTFDNSDTGSWTVSGTNTIANTNNQLDITYVDNEAGAELKFADAKDLSSDLTVGKTYIVQFDAKYTGGSGNTYMQVGSGGSGSITSKSTDLTTEMKTYKLYFNCTHATEAFIKPRDMDTGTVVTIDNISIREVNGYPGLLRGQVTSFSDEFSNEFN